MKQFYLSEITTKDGLIHQGISFKPQKHGKKALLWIHGLTGRFYGDVKMMEEMAEACEKEGFGFASFNNRGHDMITSAHKTDQSYADIGAGREVFEECVYDIHAGVDFLVSQGFTEVYLMGHSTGALKAAYSEGTKPHSNVVGVILAGGLSDRLDPKIAEEELRKNISRMEQMIVDGKGDELVSGLFFFPMTPKRYVSLFKKGSVEEVFDYGEVNPEMKIFSAITKPLFVIISEKDEYLDRPAQDAMRVFDTSTKSKNYKSIIFPGANHGFEGKEKEVVESIVKWVHTV